MRSMIGVPFPFTDSNGTIKRPAQVLSQRTFDVEGHTVLAMITDGRNQPWPLDAGIDYQSAGLTLPCVVRLKLFRLDNRLLIRRIGSLSQAGRKRAIASLQSPLPAF